VPQRSSQ